MKRTDSIDATITSNALHVLSPRLFILFALLYLFRHYLTGAACNRHLKVKPAMVTCLQLLFHFLAYGLVGQVTTNISHVVISIVTSFLINDDPCHMKAISSKEG